ncbi:MAG: long-chain-fatty-acid--CoA ligase [Burkholderiales bacterium]
MQPRRYASLIRILIESAREYPDREALICGAVRLTYRDYLARAASVGARLNALGVRGERVAILLPNSTEVCIAMFAVHAAGGTVVPLNPLYTERELIEIIEDARPRVLLFDSRRVEEVARISKQIEIACVEAIDLDEGRWADPSSRSETLSIRAPAADDLAFIQYTGGTTGRSKGVMLTHRAVCANVAQREGLLPTDAPRGERILCPMPIFHAYGLMMGLYLSAYCAGTLVIMPRYRPSELLYLVARERITIFPGSPTIFIGLMSDPGFAATDWSRVHTCYSGSAPLSEETLNRWEAATGAPIYEGYGQTEAGPILTYNPVQGTRKPGSVGIPVADTDVQIVDTELGTQVMPVGEVGEIRARGPQIMQGYWQRPDETEVALREGWLYTGDVGSLDADGYLTIRDRKKDMVIVSGYNVYPREVDEVLFMHPAIIEAATVGAPDPYRGERLCAFVVLRDGALATQDEILAHCAANLARYKIPSSVTRLDALPKTTVGKPDKRALRERAIRQ